MKLKEAAKRGIVRLAYMRDGRAVWNKYSFGDIAIFEDGTYGPWMKIYDPFGQEVCGKPRWEPIDVLTVPGCRPMACVEEEDEFEPYIPPDDMLVRLPDYPPIPGVIKTPKIKV